MKQKMNMNHLRNRFLLADYLIYFNRNFKSINSACKYVPSVSKLFVRNINSQTSVGCQEITYCSEALINYRHTKKQHNINCQHIFSSKCYWSLQEINRQYELYSLIKIVIVA